MRFLDYPRSRPIQKNSAFLFSYFLLFFLSFFSCMGKYSPSIGLAEAEESISTLEERLKVEPDNIKIRSSLALQYSRSKGQEMKVIELLSPFTDELSLSSLLQLAIAYQNVKKYTDEVRVLKKALESGPKRYDIHYKVGLAYLKSEKFTEATNSMRDAIKIQRRFRQAYDSLLDIFQRTKNNYESRGILRDMVKIFGKDPLIYSHLCRLDSIDGYLESAIKACRRAMSFERDLPDNYVYLAQSLIDSKDETSAGKVLIQAARRFPKSELAQWATGEYYLRQKNYAGAQTYFAKAVLADEKSARSLTGLAVCQFEQENHEDALATLSKACEIDENVVDKIREAAGKLRLAKKDELSRRYTKQIQDCKRKIKE